MAEQLYLLFNKTDNVVHNGKPMTVGQIDNLLREYRHGYEWQLIPFAPIEWQRSCSCAASMTIN